MLSLNPRSSVNPLNSGLSVSLPSREETDFDIDDTQETDEQVAEPNKFVAKFSTIMDQGQLRPLRNGSE